MPRAYRPAEEADDAELDASPLAKRLRCDRKTVLGDGLSQRQGQPLAALQLASLTGAESPHQALCPVDEPRESTPLGSSMQHSTDDHATRMREGSTNECAANGNRASVTRSAGARSDARNDYVARQRRRRRLEWPIMPGE